MKQIHGFFFQISLLSLYRRQQPQTDNLYSIAQTVAHLLILRLTFYGLTFSHTIYFYANSYLSLFFTLPYRTQDYSHQNDNVVLVAI